jgi:hypothetical protein
MIFLEVHNKAERLAVRELESLDYIAIELFEDMHILTLIIFRYRL